MQQDILQENRCGCETGRESRREGEAPVAGLRERRTVPAREHTARTQFTRAQPFHLKVYNITPTTANYTQS